MSEESASQVAKPGPSPLARLDELAFWAVFMLVCALVSRPIAWLAGAAGIVLTGLAYYRAGLAREPEAPDDVGFTRFFLGTTLVVYAVCAATGWEIGHWILMLCGMFLLHCTRNLMIVEKVIVVAPPPGATADPPEPQAVLASLSDAVEEAIEDRIEAGIDASGLQTALARARELMRRRFLLTQRGALYLHGPALKDLQALETDLGKAESEQDGVEDLTSRELRARKAASLRRILDAARKSHADVARFRNAMEAADDALVSIGEELEGEDFTGDAPDWLPASFKVLEATLSRAEEDLARLENAQPTEEQPS